MDVGVVGKVTGRSAQRWIIACAALATFMGTLDEFIVGISLPTITHEFGVGTGETAWVVIVYLLVITGTLITFGRLADRHGLRRLFLIGYGVFILGSLLCGLSWDLRVLIGARLIQGAGGSILRVVAFALVPKLLPREVRGWAYGILSTASAMGIVIGAPLGGLITGMLSWHWIFLVNVPIGLAAMAMVVRVLPVDRGSDRRIGLDLPGAVLSFVGFVGLTVALNRCLEVGWGSPEIVVTLGVTAAALTLFVRHEKRAANPLVDFRLFANRAFLFGNIAMFLICAYMSGDAFLIPFFLQLVKGYDASQAGLLLLAYSVVYVPTAQVAGRLSDRVRPYVLCTLAATSGAMACLLFVVTAGMPGSWVVICYMAWAAISCAAFISPSNNNVMSNAPTDRQGSAAGILSTANQLGSALGVVIFEAVFFVTGEAVGIQTVAELRPEQDLLVAGFRYAYVAGIAMCLLAAFFAYRSGAWHRSRVTATGPVPAGGGSPEPMPSN